MEIKLQKEESVDIIYVECPTCHKPFNAKRRKKTTHHIIPNFLKPKTKSTITICLECHDKLNSCYRGQEIAGIKNRYESETFEEFHKTYLNLRANFYDKKLNRGEFGEGLWSNLMSYLEAVAKEKK